MVRVSNVKAKTLKFLGKKIHRKSSGLRAKSKEFFDLTPKEKLINWTSNKNLL